MANRATVKTAKLPKYIYPFKNTDGQLRYRIRIRRKSFGGVELLAPIDEVLPTLEAARKRLSALEFGGEAEKIAFVQKTITEASEITLRELLEKFRDEYNPLRKNARDWRSRIKNIIETPVPAAEKREFQFFTLRASVASLTGNQPSDTTVFGDYPAKSCDIHLINRFVDARLKKVKPQTCINDLCTLSVGLKNAHQYFLDLSPNPEPLKDFDWKRVKYEKDYRDKRLSVEKRQAIERILIERSRREHYWQFFVFLYETGTRISEALSIKISDINLTDRIIFTKTKKNNKPRYLGITPRLLEAVIEPRMRDRQPTEFLFPYSKDTYEGKLTTIRPLLIAQGIRFSWHDLRHNYASSHLTGGTRNEVQIMQDLGLRNVDHFKSRYMEIVEAEKAAKKVAMSQQLTAQEVVTVLGHGSLGHTQPYIHSGPQNNPLQALTDLVKTQQEQIATLLDALKSSNSLDAKNS